MRSNIIRPTFSLLLLLNTLHCNHALIVKNNNNIIRRRRNVHVQNALNFNTYRQQQQQHFYKIAQNGSRQGRKYLHTNHLFDRNLSMAMNVGSESETHDVLPRNNNNNALTSKTTIETSLSPAAQWHQQRRRDMISKYASEIIPLEQESHGLFVGLPLLLISNFALFVMAMVSAKLSILQLSTIAFFPGSMFSLWQLQICHDCLHGSLLPRKDHEKMMKKNNISNHITNFISRYRKQLQKYILFWGSMPSAFGYYLYLQYGHLNHHKSLGDEHKSNLSTLFNSSKKNFEDGDALFVSHRMKLKGDAGPKVSFQLPWMKKAKIVTMSISRGGFSLWKEGHALRNATIFTISFMLERLLLIWNDCIVALSGRNLFFPNKPDSFHEEVTLYCRVALAVRLGLCYMAKSWKPFLFLYLAETLWSIPPHPACAMFITNHGSKVDVNNDTRMNEKLPQCIPSSSTYAGKLYSLFTLGTNYHVEHHDFPSIPLHKLGKLQTIAPEFYNNRQLRKRNIFSIMRETFSQAEFYACMDNVIYLD